MTLNDFMFVFGLGIVFLFIAFCSIVAIVGRNEEARNASRRKTPHRKLKHQKHVLRNA